jgi:hypothetical protein
MRRLLAILTMLGALSISQASVAGAGSSADLTAMLDGHRIDLQRVSDYHCHDLDYPVIRCYRSAEDLDRAIADRVARDPGSAGAEGTAGPAYVRVYTDASYGGTSLLISTPYDHLGSVGWNDRISSFKTLTSAGGSFWQHDLHSGWAYPFCCSSTVPYVGDAYNDQFSSVYAN